jgi:hypothetical protein
MDREKFEKGHRTFAQSINMIILLPILKIKGALIFISVHLEHFRVQFFNGDKEW